MQPSLVIFDVDGTLVDSQNLIYAAQCATFARHGREPPTREVVLRLVGLSLVPTFERLVGPGGPVDAMVETYKSLFNAVLADVGHSEPLFPGAADALAALAAEEAVALGVATGKSRRGIDRIVEMHGWHGYFDTIQTADTHPSKPDPSMVIEAMRETGARPEDTLLIGDTSFDMVMARQAGARPIGVAWGYHQVEALHDAGAERVITSFDELARLIGVEPWTVSGKSGVII
jgi:phosphoglycolate phosphatase